jgi:ferredoxin
VPTYRATFRFPNGTEHDVAVSDDEHLLDAGLAAGLDLPYSCLQGWCLTCAGRLLSGRVDQHDSRRYFREDHDAGFVLPCTARPQSDVVLETHARDAMRRNRERYHLPFPRGNWGHREGR